MELFALGQVTGKFADIAKDPAGWVVAYQDAADGAIVLVQLHPDGSPRVPDVRIDGGGGNAFPVLCVEAGATWLAYRHGVTLRGVLRNLTSGEAFDLGVVHGNNPIAFGAGWVAWQSTADYLVRVARLSNVGNPAILANPGRGTGLAYVSLEGFAITVDQQRLAYPGIVNPRDAGRVTVGENADAGPDRAIAYLWPDRRVCELWPGHVSFTPHIATDGGQFAIVTWGGPGVRLALVTDQDFRVPEPIPVPPPVLPDIPWTPDPTRTVDMLAFVTAAATARRDRGDGTGELWMHKSQERDNWGENWDFDRDYIGFVEDRSTGTRMVSMERPKTNGHTNTHRNRLSPEEILERNAHGENLGDPLTLPLAGYTWRGNRVWMIRHVTGHASVSFTTDYVWWDLPEFGGVWEVWAGLPLTIKVETGYARLNGHDVYARTRYGKPAGNEWNYWSNHGWIAFMAFNADGSEDVAARRVAPPEQRASPLTAQFVPARFTPTYPIYTPPTPTPEIPMADTLPIAEAVARAAFPAPSDIVDGARARFKGHVLDRDVIDGRLSDGAERYFGQHYYPTLAGQQIRTGVPGTADGWGHYSVIAVTEAERVYDRDQRPSTQPPPPTQPPVGSFRRIVGTLRRNGRTFADDHGYISPRGASLLYGLADGVDPVPLMDQYAAEGIQYVRVFAGALAPMEGRTFRQTAQAARTRLPAFLANANTRGLRVQVCALTDTKLDNYAALEHVRIVAQLLAGTGNWLELGNEWGHPTQDDFDLDRLAVEARSAGYTGLLTAGAREGLDELEVSSQRYPLADIGDFASTHPLRGHEPHWMGDGCRLREGEMISGTHGVPIAFGEPDKADTQPDGYAFLIGALGAGFNAAVVLHTSEGRDAKPLTGAGLAALRAFVAGHVALEAGPWGFQNAQRPGNWPDSPVTAGAFEEGDPSEHMLPGGHLWRAFSFVRDGRGFVVPTGRRPNDPNAFHIGNGWHVVGERESRVGVRLVEIAV